MLGTQRRLRQERDREIYDAYRKVNAKYILDTQVNRKMMAEEIAKIVKPRFPVTYDYAYKVLSMMNGGRKMTYKKEERRLMWEEIRKYVEEERAKNPSLTLGQAIAKVLITRKASRLYLSEEYIYRHLYNIIDEKRKYRNCCRA